MYIPHKAHAGFSFGRVTTEAKFVFAVQIRQHKCEVFFSVTKGSTQYYNN